MSSRSTISRVFLKRTERAEVWRILGFRVSHVVAVHVPTEGYDRRKKGERGGNRGERDRGGENDRTMGFVKLLLHKSFVTLTTGYELLFKTNI